MLGSRGSGAGSPPARRASSSGTDRKAFRSADAKTMAPSRPPGLRASWAPASILAGSGSSMSIMRVITASNDPGCTSIACASIRRVSTFVRPAFATASRAPSSIAGSRSVARTAPDAPTRRPAAMD